MTEKNDVTLQVGTAEVKAQNQRVPFQLNDEHVALMLSNPAAYRAACRLHRLKIALQRDDISKERALQLVDGIERWTSAVRMHMGKVADSVIKAIDADVTKGDK